MKTLVIGLVLAAAAAGMATAATASSDTSAILRGKQLAVSGNGMAPACSACHKLDGAGEPDGAFPRITGQAPLYLYQQLRDFADGRRHSKIMGPIASKLSKMQMQDLAAYYASVTAPSSPSANASGDLIASGAALSDVGSNSERVPACASCHGPGGTGFSPIYPYLAGQFGGVIKGELQSFKKGQRTNDPVGVMRDIASNLSSHDIRALAAYFAGLPAPAKPAAGIDTLFATGKPRVLAGSPTARQSAQAAPSKANN